MQESEIYAPDQIRLNYSEALRTSGTSGKSGPDGDPYRTSYTSVMTDTQEKKQREPDESIFIEEANLGSA